MSNSESSSIYILTINVSNEYKYLVNILLFDSCNRIVKPDERSSCIYKYKIKKGLYTIRVELNAEINDKVISLDGDKEFLVSSNLSNKQVSNIIEPPKQYSSALLFGDNIKTYISSHEYYTKPAIELSMRDTFTLSSSLNNNANSSLFIFMRFPSNDKYNNLRNKWTNSFYRNFEIVDEFGVKIFNFDSRIGLEVNEDDGWLAFNATLNNGIYYLIYSGNEPRQVPIYVFKNWHTQFFITLGDVPLFGTTRIFISKERKFNPNSIANKYIDVLLDKLQNGDYFIDEELIKIATNKKFESPMLGLICSYVYFKSHQTKKDRIFKDIINNLQQVILKDNDESPEIRALNILSAEHFGNTNYTNDAVKGTPMLRIGFETINNASVKNNSLIPLNSINDFISESQYYDTPFNTFKPISFNNKPETAYSLEMNNDQFVFDQNNETENMDEKEKPKIDKGFKNLKFKSKIFDLSLNNLLNSNIISSVKKNNAELNNENHWIRNSISDLLNQNNNLSINEISQQLNLSANTIFRILDDWQKENN